MTLSAAALGFIIGSLEATVSRYHCGDLVPAAPTPLRISLVEEAWIYTSLLTDTE